MDYANKTRPKGYNAKVWLACFAEAAADREWAFKTVKDAKWTSSASTMSLQHLGECLSKQEHVRAKEIYDYLDMRAHGETFLGALDPSARKKWESITGRKVSSKRLWHYDHTKQVTSANWDGKKWTSWLGGKEDISYKRSA